MSLFDYEAQFKALRLHVESGLSSATEVVLMQTTMGLVADGGITRNRIEYTQALRQQFSALNQGGYDTAYKPFVSLSRQSFWHHKVVSEHIGKYQQILQDQSARNLNNPELIIEYAYLDDELFELFRSERARRLLTAALSGRLDDTQRDEILDPGTGWSWQECESIVADYFEMLKLELTGNSYVKAQHNRELQDLIGRKRPAIELKHMNISAVLHQMGCPTIDGYKPLSNYQREILPDIVGAFVAKHGDITKLADGDLALVTAAGYSDILNRREQAPDRLDQNRSVALQPNAYHPRKVDYIERFEQNTQTGAAGEDFVLAYEKARLIDCGKVHLADQIEQVSLTDDSLGFDVKSYEKNGTDRLIEVKTTTLTSRFTQFFFTLNELETSKRLADKYHLYRLYNFKYEPRFFVRSGDISSNFDIFATQFRARL